MVESNFHRTTILPSEKAFAYKMRFEAMKRQGKCTDLTSSPVGTKLRTDDIIAQESGDSRNQIHRYIRLTKLVAYMLMTRLSVDTEMYFDDDDFRNIVKFNFDDTLKALGVDTSAIAEMGL